MFYLVLILHLFFPVFIFVMSIYIGKRSPPIKWVWMIPVGFTAARSLNMLLTLSLWQQLEGGAASFPGVDGFLAIAAVSAVGLLIGAAWSKKNQSVE